MSNGTIFMIIELIFRRYGEIRYGQVSVSVEKNSHLKLLEMPVATTNETTSTSTTTSTTSTEPPHLRGGSGIFRNRNININRTKEEEEEYQRSFFILRVIVRITVVLTLIILAGSFGVLYLHNWRLWDQTQAGPGVGGPVGAKFGARSLSDSEEDTDEELYQELDPMLKRKLVATRRKSVAFSVCVVDRENMTFDLESKRVMLGLGSRSTDRLPVTMTAGLLPTLQEDCETGAAMQSIPLVIPEVRGRGRRRMSVPAVCLTKTLHEEGLETDRRLKMFTSSETII